MRKILSVQVPSSHVSRRLLWVGMIALLLASVLFAGQSAGKVSALSPTDCTTTSAGLWSAPAVWNCGHVPTAGENVILNHALTLDANQAVTNVTINNGGAGLIFAADQVLTINGNLVVSAGAPTPISLGSVVLGGVAQTINTNAQWVEFTNLSKTNGGSLSVDKAVAAVVDDDPLEGGLHISGMLTLKGTDAAHRLALQSTTLGAQWQLWLEVTGSSYAISYVDVQDSRVSANGIDKLVSLTGLDSGNNFGWVFAAADSSLLLTRESASPIAQETEAIFEAAVTPADLAGTVEFRYGDVTIPSCGNVALDAAGIASCSVEELPVGTHAITAVFTSSVDGFSNIVSNAVEQVISPTSFLLDAAAFDDQLIADGETTTVSLLAIIDPMPNSGVVAFKDGGVDVPGCSAVALSKGRAVCNATMAAGAHIITTVFNSVTSLPFMQLVQKASAVAATSLNPEVANRNNAVNFKATVTSPSPATGSVTFRNRGLNIPGCINLPLTANVASCTIAKPLLGAYSITAVYNGDKATFIASSSSTPSLLQLVKAFYFLPTLRR